jgi:hypothetical protein
LTAYPGKSFRFYSVPPAAGIYPAARAAARLLRFQPVPGMHNPFRAAVISSTRNPVSAKKKLSPLRSRHFFFPCLLFAFLFLGSPIPACADSLEVVARALVRKVAAVPQREAMSLSLDRQTMANVLLQKQAEPASALLPQWLSGYAFLFTMETNIDRAKEIRASLPVKMAAGTEPLRLRVDAPGDPAKLLGERVAVNARQAAILVQVVNRAGPRGATTATTALSDPATGIHLFSWHYSSPSPTVELESMVSALNFGDSPESAVCSTDPEQFYTREKKLLEERRLRPLVALPEYIGLSQNVRDWMPARCGEWHLADVWLDLPELSPTQPGNPNGTATPGTQPLTASPGAKP